jgi:hypothetical protein
LKVKRRHHSVCQSAEERNKKHKTEQRKQCQGEDEKKRHQLKVELKPKRKTIILREGTTKQYTVVVDIEDMQYQER